ncbi:MAG: hypothetical protein P4L36_19595 [Holophaga sp.]|nr:hypothetical protein [Holophaga sp.]
MTLSSISPLTTAGVPPASPNPPAPPEDDPGADAIAAQLESPADSMSISSLGQALSSSPDTVSGPSALMGTYNIDGSVASS